MRRLWCTILGLWLLAGIATAAIIDTSFATSGNVVTAQTTTGASANTLRVGRGKYRALVIMMNNTGAGSGTAQLEINCNGPTTTWALVANSSTVMAASTTAALNTVYPACDYRINVTACTTCNMNVDYFLGPEIQ